MRISEPSHKLLVSIGIVLMAIGISSTVAAHAHHASVTAKVAGPVINLLPLDWQYLDGVTPTANSLNVAATDSKIVKQDGTGGQANPAVNLYGTYLKSSGDFAFTTHLAGLGNGTGTVQLYDTPPVIADEFRVEPASVAVTLHGTTMTVQVWNGDTPADPTDPQPVFSNQADITQPAGDITITRSGNDITVQTGDTTVTAGGTGKLFRSGSIWLGLSSPDSGFQADKLTAQGLNGNNLATADTTQLLGASGVGGLQALASAVRPGFTVGAAVALGPIVSNATYRSELLQNFSSITLENAMKPQFIAPKQGVYTFQEADALIAFAHRNGMTVHGHTLAFSEAEPAWMRNLPTATAADRQATTTTLLGYVTDVTTHFKGQLDSLDVINEPLDTDQGTTLQHNIWYKAMGPDYMVQVSQAVHAADPAVKQYVNENGAEMAGDRQDALLKLIQHINSQGGYIYGVGLQAHVYDMSTDAISATALNTTFDRFAAAGLKVRISENDVTDDSGKTAQAQQYSTIFTTCLHNPNCVSYTSWGVDNHYDYFIDDDGSLQQGHDFLFNNGKQTSSYTSLLQKLQ